jgi:poly(beta-D-mannuronate) lyase
MAGKLTLCAIAACAATCPAFAEDHLVRDQQEYARALERLEAGDRIILADGEWRDFEMVVTGRGEAQRPISVSAQTPGGVTLTGQSNLRIGGQYIHVSGLVFRDGYSPTGAVISFRRDAGDVARYSRVSEVVIDGFSKPDRNETDYWVSIHGQNNRFDHNHLAGKTNRGVTLAVRLDAPESRENHHRIDHNYFGPRPVLGSNGGETLRIGTSHFSMFNSNTLIENNVFDRCDGEVEIISSKSGGNVFRNNLFLRSQGSLTLRHGDGNLVERNVFLGYGKDNTGGIRVINRDQTVRDNYMEGLRGSGFAGALTVMNGVPNSPVNRYVQVEGAQIRRNSIIDSTRITLGAGADEERSAAPIESVFADNLLGGASEDPFIRADADLSGIAFENNAVIAGEVDASLDLPRVATDMARAENGLLYPIGAGVGDVGAPRDLAPVRLDQVGVAWYPKPGNEDRFGAGEAVSVAADGRRLVDAVRAAGEGGRLRLAPGEYLIDRTLGIDSPLTIEGVAGDDGARPVIRFSRPSLFEIRDGGSLRLSNVVIDGELAPDSVGNSVIRTSALPIFGNFDIELDRVHVRNLTVNRGFNVLTLGRSTLADRVEITDSRFENISGSVVSATAETDDIGKYNVDYLDVRATQFIDIGGPAIDVYRGGTDESTFGPNVAIANSSFANVGRRVPAAAASSIQLHGVQQASIVDNAFIASEPVSVIHTVGTPETRIAGNRFEATPEPVGTELVHGGDFRGVLVHNVVIAGGGE